jgi:D-glycero-alpha-D-manno-heptose 1-phosphate guanylyltransferase
MAMAKILAGIPDTLAVILAGGLGTRLRSVVADRPKVLAPVLQRPFVSYLLDQLAAVGIKQVVLLTGYRAGQVAQELGSRHTGMELFYSPELTPLGTAGALRAAMPLLSTSNILLLNGDSYCHVDLAGCADIHRRQRADLSLVVTAVEDSGRYGQVVLASNNQVSRFVEKQPGPSGQKGWINAGIYLLSRGLVEEIPPGRSVSLEREMLPAWTAPGHGKRVFGYCCPGPFLDIGTPESYTAAESFFAGTYREAFRESLQTCNCLATE